MVSILGHNEFNFSGMQRCHASSNYVCHQRCQRASKRPPSRSTLSQQAVCHASVWRAVEYVLNVRHNLSNWLSLSPHVSVPGSVGWLWPTRWTIYKSLISNQSLLSPSHYIAWQFVAITHEIFSFYSLIKHFQNISRNLLSLEVNRSFLGGL